MIIDTAIQGTPEWMKARIGIPTSSNFDNIVTTKGEPSKQREKYLYTLSAERVSGVKEETYQNFAMQKGIEREAESRRMYELMSGNTVVECGLCYQDERKLWGASPDGLIGEDGAFEVKNPTAAVAVGYLLEGKLPTSYFVQVQGQLLVTGRKWVDFLSFYQGLRPLLIRVEPDKVFQIKLQVELELFCTELNQIVERIK